ncbi:MAG: type I-E CRISPR-associated protein Cas6/Cse3/CasE [Gordonia sp. (in: high G+C Gram-positive bacteria)]
MTKIAINRRRRGAMKLLGSRHAMHAAVMSSFSPGTPTESEEGRVLWRVDKLGDDVDLYIVSPGQPCPETINEQAGWSTGAVWASRDYSQFLTGITNGQEFVFRLVANPTHRLSTSNGGAVSKKVVAHVTDEYQRQWFLDRTDTNGFSVVESTLPIARETGQSGDVPRELIVRERETSVFKRGPSRVTLATAAFEGRLTVTDADLIRRALTHGIGRGKGYGCGLITLAPVN